MIVVVPGRVGSLAGPPRSELLAWLRDGLEALLPLAERKGVVRARRTRYLDAGTEIRQRGEPEVGRNSAERVRRGSDRLQVARRARRNETLAMRAGVLGQVGDQPVHFVGSDRIGQES